MDESTARAAQKRKHLRLEVQLPLKWEALGPGENGGGSSRESSTVDISAGGLSFEARERLEVGTYIELEISPTSDGQVPVVTRGVVGWCRKTAKEGRFSVGVRFLSPPETPLHRLLLDTYQHLGQFRTVCDDVRSCGELKYNCEAWLTSKNCWQIDGPPCCHWRENRDCLHCPVSTLCFLS